MHVPGCLEFRTRRVTSGPPACGRGHASCESRPRRRTRPTSSSSAGPRRCRCWATTERGSASLGAWAAPRCRRSGCAAGLPCAGRRRTGSGKFLPQTAGIVGVVGQLDDPEEGAPRLLLAFENVHQQAGDGGAAEGGRQRDRTPRRASSGGGWSRSGSAMSHLVVVAREVVDSSRWPTEPWQRMQEMSAARVRRRSHRLDHGLRGSSRQAARRSRGSWASPGWARGSSGS